MSDVVSGTKKALDLFKDLVWDTLVEAKLSALIASSVFFSFGPLKMLLTGIILHFMDMFYAAFKLFIVIEAIPIREKLLLTHYTSASINLKKTAARYGIDSPEFKEQRNADKKRLADMLRYNA